MNKQMVALCSILCLCSLFFVSQVFANGTYNKRENREHAPISIDTKSGDTPYAIEIKNGDGAAGSRTGGIDSDGKPLMSWKDDYLVVDTEAEAEAGSRDYNLYMVDTTTYTGPADSVFTGVSFYMPAGDEALDGFHVRIVNVTVSGTSDVILVPADDCTRASGITDVMNTTYAFDGVTSGVTGQTDGATQPLRVYNILDNHLEMAEFTYRYAAGGGTWYQTGGVSRFVN